MVKTGFCSFTALFHAHSNDCAKKAMLLADLEQRVRAMIGMILSNQQAQRRRSPAIRQPRACWFTDTQCQRNKNGGALKNCSGQVVWMALSVTHLICPPEIQIRCNFRTLGNKTGLWNSLILNIISLSPYIRFQYDWKPKSHPGPKPALELKTLVRCLPNRVIAATLNRISIREGRVELSQLFDRIASRHETYKSHQNED